MSHAGPTGQMPCPPGDGGPRGGCPLTSKSWYCSSVSALLATTSVRRPSRAMFPHWESTGRSQARHWRGTPLAVTITASLRSGRRRGIGKGAAPQHLQRGPRTRCSQGRPHAIALSTTRGQVLVVLFFKLGKQVYNQNFTWVPP